MINFAICAALFGMAAILLSVSALMTMFMLDCHAEKKQKKDEE